MQEEHTLDQTNHLCGAGAIYVKLAHTGHTRMHVAQLVFDFHLVGNALGT